LIADVLRERWILAGVYAIATVLVGRLGGLLLGRLFRQRLAERLVPRAATVAAVASSVWTYTIALSGLGLVLNALGIDLTALLGAAGIAGIAVALGAQTLIRDWLAGFFLLAENQIAVGDYVAFAGAEGVVVSIGLRATRLRDVRGRLVTVPNGQIALLTNYTRAAMGGVEISLPLKDADVAALCADARACAGEQSLDGASVQLTKVEGGYAWIFVQFEYPHPTPAAMAEIRLTLVAALQSRGWKLFPA